MRWAIGAVCAVMLSAAPAGAVEFKEALAAFKDADYPKVVSLLDEYLKEHPKEMRAYALRGRALVESGQFEKAIPDLDKAISAGFGEGGMPLYLRGRAHLGLGDTKKAIADLDKAIEAKPDAADRYLVRGQAWARFIDRKKALADFDKVIELEPKNVQAWADRGRTRLEHSCDIATFQYEQNGRTYVSRRLESILDKAGVDAAMADLNKALELDPEHFEARYARMEGWLVHGNKGAERMRDLRALCELRPKDPSLWNGLAWDLATHYVKSFRNGKEAVEAAEKADELTHHKNVAILDTLAAAYAEAGNFDKAIKTQSRLIELVTGDDAKRSAGRRLELFKNRKPYHRPRPPEKPKAGEQPAEQG